MSRQNIHARFGWLLAGPVLLVARAHALAVTTVTTGTVLSESPRADAPESSRVDAWGPVAVPDSDVLLASWYRPDAPPPQSAIPSHPALTDRFWFGAGAFLSTATTELRLDSSSGIGTNLNLEDVMGLDETTWAPQGLGRWRISDRWRIEAEYFEVDRSRTRQTTQDINWGDQTFPAGTQIETQYNVSVTRVSAGYSFFKTQDKELGVALGFHLTHIHAGLSSSGGGADGAAVLAPLPVLSGYGQVALTDTWAIAGRLDAFKIEYDPYKGAIYSIGINALCQPWRHVGFGFGWQSLLIKASASSSDWEGNISSNFQGPIAFISCSF